MSDSEENIVFPNCVIGTGALNMPCGNARRIDVEENKTDLNSPSCVIGEYSDKHIPSGPECMVDVQIPPEMKLQLGSISIDCQELKDMVENFQLFKEQVRLLEEHFLYLLSFLVKDYGKEIGPAKIFDSYLDKKAKLKEEK